MSVDKHYPSIVGAVIMLAPVMSEDVYHRRNGKRGGVQVGYTVWRNTEPAAKNGSRL
jgi:hypothetical protein